MKYFQLEGTINEELLTKFMDFCNNNLSEDCTIVINSGGGKCNISTVILNIINAHSDKITLVSAGVYSAAFYIFYFAKCKRKIVYGSLGMHHKDYINDISINPSGTPKFKEDVCQVENIKSIGDRFTNKFLSKEEKEKYKKSEDVYFTFKRMTEIFPDIEIIK